MSKPPWATRSVDSQTFGAPAHPLCGSELQSELLAAAVGFETVDLAKSNA